MNSTGTSITTLICSKKSSKNIIGFLLTSPFTNEHSEKTLCFIYDIFSFSRYESDPALNNTLNSVVLIISRIPKTPSERELNISITNGHLTP